MGWHDPVHGPDCYCEDCRPVRDEHEQVGAWRLRELCEAGYPLGYAQLIAGSSADLHKACELVAVKGCPPETAAKILL